MATVNHTSRENFTPTAKLVGLTPMCLIDRAYPIQVTALQTGKSNDVKFSLYVASTRRKVYTDRLL